MIKVTVYLTNGKVIEYWKPNIAEAKCMEDFIDHEGFMSPDSVIYSAMDVDRVEVELDPHVAKHARSLVRQIVAEISGRYGTVSNMWNRLDPDMQAKSIIRWREIARDVLKVV